MISCGKRKLSQQAKAKNLFTSTLFKLSLKHAQQQRPNDIYILSAKYGLIDLDEIVAPYELTLNTMRIAERRFWAERVLMQNKERTYLENDLFIILTVEKYREFLIPKM